MPVYTSLDVGLTQGGYLLVGSLLLKAITFIAEIGVVTALTLMGDTMWLLILSV
ncbi:MAG: hypothetical protein ACJ70U_01750 [Nitrososphaera sp.]